MTDSYTIMELPTEFAGAPIEVDLPDGSIAEFPAGTPQAVMEKACREFWNKQQEPRRPLLRRPAPGTPLGTALNIGGKRVKVGDNFRTLSPDQQNATVEEIARSLNIQASRPNQNDGYTIEEIY